MPFLSSIFRKDKDKDGPSSPSHSTFSRARSRPSIASSRECASPPPQLADISPQSDLSYVLPELEELQATSIVHKLESKEPEPVKKRGIGFGRRRESTNSTLVISSPTSATSPPRPFSDMDIDRHTPIITTNHNNPNLHSDSDDDPLVPPPPRASVFAGYSYSDQDRPRAQSVPAERERPPRPQVHPHQTPESDMAKGKLKKDGSSTRGGLFSWRTKSAKEVPTAISTDSSFSLKSFRHVGPPSPVVRPSESTASLPVVGGTPNSSFSRSTSTGSPVVPSPTTASTSTARPVPGRSTPTTRERVNSTSSEGVMTAGLFRQAARRSSTNLVEEAAEPIRSRMRDLDKRGPPTARTWTDDTSSGSDRATAGPRKSAPDNSSRKTTLENKSQPRKSTPAPSSGRNAPVPQKSLADSDEEPTSPFAGRLGESGRTSPFTTRSESGHAPRDFSHIPRVDYSMYGARSDGGIRGGSKLASSTTSTSQSRVSSPASPTKSILSSHTLTTSPGTFPSNLPSITSTRPGPQGYTSSRSTSPTKPRPSSPVKRTTPPSPTKPRLSAPTATRPPVRTTVPTKTNDGPSIKPGSVRGNKRQGSGSSQASSGQSGYQASGQSGYQGLGHGRRPSASESMRSVSVDAFSHSRQPSTDTLSQLRGDTFSHARQQSTDTLSQQQTRRPSVDVLSHTRRPSGFEVISRPKSPGPSAAVELRPTQHTKTTDQLRQEAIEAMRGAAKSPAPSFASRLNDALGPSQVSSWAQDTQASLRTHDTQASSRTQDAQPSSRAQDTQATPRKNYVPPPRQSSLAAGALVDSDSDESPEEVESESEGLGFGKSAGVGAMRGRHGHGKETRPGIGNGLGGSPPGRVDRSAANTANQTTANAVNRSPRSQTHHSHSNSEDQPGLTRERTITQRDAPPKIGVSLFDSPVSPRARASHSTSAISAAATARNSAALADTNRANVGQGSRPNAPPEGKRANVTTTRPGAKKHTRGSSFGAGSVSHVRAPAVATDTDEDEEDESEESSEDDAPLSSLAPAKRPGSAASTAASVRPGPRPSAPQPRATAPLINIPGVTAPPPRPPRINRVPGVGVTRNSSLRGSRSVEDLGRKPVGPPRPGPRPFITSPPSSTGDSSSGKAPLTPRDGSEAGRGRSDEARRKERRRSEAKKSVELGNVINGPGPFPDDEDEDAISMGHSQMGHTMGMMGMGWNQSGFFPPGGAAFGGPPGFPTSQSMPFLHPQMTGQPMPMPFMPAPPPPGANEAYLQAHQQAMIIAKQTYLQAVAQQAMAAATEQWERSSNMGGSVYGGSQSSMNMGMMGMPMMGMYAGSSYAASAYEGSVAGWGSASAYGGPSGPRSVYGGGGARSEFGGGIRSKPAGQNRARGKTQTGGSDAQAARRDPVPPSTWATRRKAGI
ncbi:unnamed protein product [Rhizoctonia solani]|uniref:Uncharacterized protein n=1 Tax=Rhizoctonia solani TaxID=456999 RepID=A0A8H3GP76_9AGAM|nr:unnamed protein product [Rhizoctonia solani]